MLLMFGATGVQGRELPHPYLSKSFKEKVFTFNPALGSERLGWGCEDYCSLNFQDPHIFPN